MFRSFFATGCRAALTTVSRLAPIAKLPTLQHSLLSTPRCVSNTNHIVAAARTFSSLQPNPVIGSTRPLLAVRPIDLSSVRTVIKYSLTKGKRKTVKAVLQKFYRLDWGIWIRGRAGRHKRVYKKSFSRRRRARQHVFTNATQSWLLDKMVTKYWRRAKHYPDSPYNPYHKREEFQMTRRKPHAPIAF